jgi:polysaccharide pyruvyl transferase WcaK-like protein
MQKKKILIYGYYGHSNVGDESFVFVFNQFLSENFDIEYRSPSTIQEFSNDYHALIIGGGNLLGEYFLGRLFDLGWINHPNVYVIGCGLSDNSGLQLISQFNIKYISIRNISEIVKVKPFFPEVVSIPDIVIALDVPKSSNKCNDILYNNKKNVGFILSFEYFPNISHSLTFEEYSKFSFSLSNLSKIINKFYRDWNVYLISMSNDPSHYDEAISWIMYRQIDEAYVNTKVINKGNSPYETIEFISQLDHLYSMKYHGIIFGLITEIKTFNLSQNIKNTDIMSLFELNDCNIDISCENNLHGLDSLIKEKYDVDLKLSDAKTFVNLEFIKIKHLLLQ